MPRRALGPAPRSWLRQEETDQARVTHAQRLRTFGVKDLTDADWKDPADETERGLIEAAKVQHEVGQSLNSIISRSGKTVAAVAADIGMSEDGVYRIINGTHHASLTDLARIASVCGWRVGVAFSKQPGDGDQPER